MRLTSSFTCPDLEGVQAVSLVGVGAAAGAADVKGLKVQTEEADV